MTDTYGSGTRDHEIEHETAQEVHETEVVHEPPSDYEFADEGAANIEGEVGEDGGGLDGEEDAKPARRSPLLPILAALGGVVLLGAVGWWQFGGSSERDYAAQAPAMTVPPAAAVKETPKEVVLPVSAKTASVASGDITPAEVKAAGTSAIPTTAEQPAVQTALPSSVAAVLSPVPAAPVPVASAPMAPAPTATTPSSSAPAAVVSAPLPAPVSTVSAVPYNAPSAVPVSDNADRRIAALTSRIDDLQKALDQTAQQLGQVTTALAANTAVTPASAPSKELQDRLDKLEKQLATSRGAPAPAPKAVPASIALTSDVLDVSPIKDVAPTKDVALAKKKIAEPKAQKTHKKKATQASIKHVKEKPVVEAKSAWVLRAASPGQAWIASTPTSRDLKQVQVGDTVPGIGRVTAIQIDGEKWIVQGLKGSIK